MRLVRIGLVSVLVLCVVLFLGPVFASGGDKGDDFAPDRLLVKFKADADGAAKGKVHARHGGRVIGEIAALGVQVVEVPAGKVKEKVEAYKAEKAVEYVEPDGVAQAVGIPNDPLFEKQWGLNNTGQTGGTPDADIDAPEAWEITSSAPAVKVAILETGIDQDHEDLAAKIAANVNFTTSPTVDDLFGHGTHVAGIAAAYTDNGLGVAGAAYAASLVNVKVLDDTGSGYYSWIASGIIWAADNGAKVINMSLGGRLPSLTLRRAVDYAWAKGAVLVAAAGNSNTTKALYPAYYRNCIAVAATDANDLKASFSNYGKWVDVAAPGVGIWSTLPNHPSVIGNYLGVTSYGLLDGTSMATPHVAGVAALVWATGYGTSNLAVRSRVETTADRIAGSGTYWVYGRVNAYNAVQ
ncbi:MAG: S8 family serine peptidase [Thermoanaerobacteraceae bacterium]|nr:S8 family serine peptidase [Thermoanaerobacteraceae bacterium]